jgi:putative alpha-1,2-mannosidase
LDYAAACYAASLVARGAGDTGLAERMLHLAGYWRNAFDPRTGLLLEDSEYYEGTRWNYSFRLLHDMAGRIALGGGDEAFVRLLDAFFGYTDIEEGCVHPSPAAETFRRLPREDRFEGLNNESDMETPYAYIYAGRHDRTAEVIRAVMRYQFAAGEGGLPGNEDSGGLSSWYVWNAIGLFPVAGQDLYLIGSPVFESAAIQLADGTFTVEAARGSDDDLYVREATLNGEPLDRAWLRVGEVRAGGRLVLRMGDTPGAWARDHRPPSGAASPTRA